jgi:hypothetical protein
MAKKTHAAVAAEGFLGHSEFYHFLCHRDAVSLELGPVKVATPSLPAVA